MINRKNTQRVPDEVDFELQKQELARALHDNPPAQKDNSQKRRYKYAFFLLFPGATEIYDKLLVRIEKNNKLPKVPTVKKFLDPSEMG